MRITVEQLDRFLERMFDALPPPKGMDPVRLAAAYRDVLKDFSTLAVDTAIRRVCHGEVASISPRFMPHPPELATIVREIEESHRHAAASAARAPSRPQAEPEIYQPFPGEETRMRLKMPMFRAATGDKGRMENLARASWEGLQSMIVLASNWGVAIPQELYEVPMDQAERQWSKARKHALDYIRLNPPPYMRSKKGAKHAER